jgi:hypothetical protein
MIKITELLVNEDREYSIDSHKFDSVAAFRKFAFFEQLIDGQVVDKPEYKDNFGEDMDPVYVDKFKRKIRGKNGIIVDWGVEYDRSYAFIEYDGSDEERALLLTDDVKILQKLAEVS